MPDLTLQPGIHQLAGEIKQRARSLGFDRVGIASAEPSKYRDYLRDWLDDGQHGSMHWLSKRFDERTDLNAYMPGAHSVICVAINYHVPLSGVRTAHHSSAEEGVAEEAAGSAQPTRYRVPNAVEAASGRIARYALGDDYHELIKSRLFQLADWMRQNAPSAETRCAVDTAPLMEKELAARAGIGWMGKNTCIINEEIGSWVLLGEVVTTLELPADTPATDRCGTCRRCIDACPTGAITEPYQLDARKCISYLTIEHREEIAPALRPQIGEWLFGCDICQDVCPWNDRAPISLEGGFQPRFATGTIDPLEVENWRPEDYAARLKGSAMKRVKLPVLQRNARIVADNQSPSPAG